MILDGWTCKRAGSMVYGVRPDGTEARVAEVVRESGGHWVDRLGSARLGPYASAVDAWDALLSQLQAAGLDLEASPQLWLQTRRELRGWTQSELSRRTGLDRATIIDLERGRKTPHALTVRKLFAALRPPSDPPAPAQVAPVSALPAEVPGHGDESEALALILTAARAPAHLPLPMRVGWVLARLEQVA